MRTHITDPPCLDLDCSDNLPDISKSNELKPSDLHSEKNIVFS